MHWKSKDGTLHSPDEQMVVVTLDHFIVMKQPEPERVEHKIRDNLVEMGLEKTYLNIARDNKVLENMVSDKVDLDTKYKLFGLWIAGLLTGVEKGSEEDAKDASKSMSEDQAEVEKKRRRYVT